MSQPFIYKYTLFLSFCFEGCSLGIWRFPGWGVKSELQLLTYTTTTATQDPRRICDLHHRSRQHGILNPLSEARDRTCNLMVTSRVVTTEPQRELQLYIFK